ncbi:MAG TPA: MFS transporter [Frankiaceae bacterium]|nr:MFS transporter [Frankiaceae bacterium]
MTTIDSPFADSAPDPRRWRALSVLALVQFMLILDVTVVNVALPHIQADLHFSRSGLAWVVDGYVLMAGGFLLLGGRISDLVGRRRLFLAGTIVFGLASLTCGAAASSGMLVASRFVQGLGEAMAAPAALGLVAVLFRDPRERVKALGVWGGLAGLGGTVGTIISGALTNISSGSWRLIFLVNIPVALFAVIALPRLVSESRATRSRTRQRPDVLGAVTATAGLSGLVYGFLRAGEVAWGSVSVLLPLVGGAALLAAFVAIERVAREPLVPLRFFRNRTRVTTNGVTVLFSAAFFAYFYLQTLYLQQVLHWSALKTGLSYVPFGIAISLAIGLATVLIPKLGVKILMTVGFTLSAAGVLLLTRISVDGSYLTQVLPPMLILGAGAGLCFPGFGNAALHEVSGQDASLASGVQNAGQQVGGAIGLAVLVTLATRSLTHAVARGTSVAAAATHAYAMAFAVSAGILALGAVLVAVFLSHTIRAPQPADVLPEGVVSDAVSDGRSGEVRLRTLEPFTVDEHVDLLVVKGDQARNR